MPRKEPIINWEKILKQWFTFTREQKEEYREIASSYSRCAVGEQRMRHPKVVVYSGGDGQFEPLPTDQPLYNLGFRFYENLNDAFYAEDKAEEGQHIAEAASTLNQIKHRVKKLIKEAHA